MKKALIVDNHPVMLKYMTGLLEKRGMEVRAAEDGLSALELLKTDTPDVIFTDMIMPNIDGEKLCKIIREKPELDKTYLVILSSVAADEDLDFTGLGANACIAKGPFDEMAQNVSTVLEGLESGDLASLASRVFGAEETSDTGIARELLSSKRHIEVILENISEGVLELTMEGNIVYANAFARYLTGQPVEDMLGNHFSELFEAGDRDAIQNLLAPEGMLPRSISKDAPLIINRKPVSINVLPVQKKAGRSFIVILNDVSELARLKQKLRECQVK